MASLITSVSLFDESGNLHSFGPGGAVPDWARKRITNPQVWDSPTSPGDTPAPGLDSAGTPPPQGGPGASRQVWADYATRNRVPVQDDWRRDDIIEACKKAGIEV